MGLESANYLTHCLINGKYIVIDDIFASKNQYINYVGKSKNIFIQA